MAPLILYLAGAFALAGAALVARATIRRREFPKNTQANARAAVAEINAALERHAQRRRLLSLGVVESHRQARPDDGN